jgi:hypothetical protein
MAMLLCFFMKYLTDKIISMHTNKCNSAFGKLM